MDFVIFFSCKNINSGNVTAWITVTIHEQVVVDREEKGDGEDDGRDAQV